LDISSPLMSISWCRFSSSDLLLFSSFSFSSRVVLICNISPSLSVNLLFLNVKSLSLSSSSAWFNNSSVLISSNSKPVDAKLSFSVSRESLSLCISSSLFVILFCFCSSSSFFSFNPFWIVFKLHFVSSSSFLIFSTFMFFSSISFSLCSNVVVIWSIFSVFILSLLSVISDSL